ncbi:MMPL family transporter [Kangiella sp.]|uniref:MMPL family transporter n=1 Tax=Kangiella sp. TaxID=1920245 RepID=UPI003A8E0967
MSVKLKALFWLIFILLTAELFYKQLSSSTGFNIETNILNLLPETEADPFAEEAFAQFSDQNFKQIILGIKTNKDTDFQPLAQTLIAQLKQTQLIERFNTQITESEQQAIAEVVFEHRFHLLNEADRKLMYSAGTEPFIDDSLQILYSPLSGQLLNLMPEDPLLLSYRYLQNSVSQNQPSSQAQIVDDLMVFSQPDHNLVILSALLKRSPFDTETQDRITETTNNFASSHPDVELLTTGAVFYAKYAAASAKSEISTIGVGSLIGVILLLIVAFRSVAPLFMTLTSLAVGIFVAFTVVHYVFGSIHILTLVFGASLLGVAVDYAFHYFSSAIHHSKPLPHIFMAIVMGLISSVIGYTALYMAPFPGLQQMAVFCATGLVGAFVTVVLLFDAFHYKVSTPLAFLSVLKKHHSVSQKLTHRYVIVSLLVLPILAGYLLLTADQNNDNIRQLQAAPAELIEQEAMLTQITAAPATNQFFLLRANSSEQLLDTINQFDTQLDQLVTDNVISSYSHLGHFVPSRSQQEADYQLIGQQLTLSNLQPLFEVGILDQQTFAELNRAYRTSHTNYLQLPEWLQSPIGQRFSYLWLGNIEGKATSIISLSNIKNIHLLEQLAEQNPNLYFINKVDKISQLFTSYRELATYMLLLACLAILILLLLKYNLLIACHVVLAPLLAASVAIIMTILVTGSFNLFSTLALFLVFGIGIDYGLFYAEAKTRSIYIHLAVTLSATTTFLSFGLLSLSETPAIHAFGLTMLTGILTVFLLSPILGSRIYHIKGLNHA